MDAFLEMRRAGGSADVAALAGGISTALGTTMLGLILAIPCLIAYGVLRNKVDRLTTEGGLLAEEFLLMISPTSPAPRPPAAPVPPAAAVPPPAPPPPRPRPARRRRREGRQKG